MNNNIKYFFPRIKNRLGDIEYTIKRRLQRAVRGYGDADIWNMSDFLAEFLYKMMDRFIKSDRIGCPVEFGDDDEAPKGIPGWEDILVKIRDGFKAADDIVSDNCPEEYPYIGVDYILNPELQSEEHKQKVSDWFDKHQIWYDERRKTFEEGMDLFKKYFFALWD